MRISDWSSDVCSSDLDALAREKYAPATKAAALVVSSQNRADTMQRLADDRGQEVESLRARLAAAEAKAEAARKDARSEERRGGKEWGSTCRTRWSPSH